jgi:hypothetical protein
MENSAQDMAGGRLMSAAKGQNLISQYTPAMKLLYSPEERQAMTDVQRAIEISGRINKSVSGVAGSQTADLIGTPGQMLRQYLPLNPKWRMLRLVFNKMKSGYDAEVNEYLARAMYDPVTASELLSTVRMGKTSATAAAKKLQQDVGIAIAGGLVSMNNSQVSQAGLSSPPETAPMNNPLASSTPPGDAGGAGLIPSQAETPAPGRKQWGAN